MEVLSQTNSKSGWSVTYHNHHINHKNPFKHQHTHYKSDIHTQDTQNTQSTQPYKLTNLTHKSQVPPLLQCCPTKILMRSNASQSSSTAQNIDTWNHHTKVYSQKSFSKLYKTHMKIITHNFRISTTEILKISIANSRHYKCENLKHESDRA